MLRGRIIAESLRPGVELRVPDLTLVRIVREDVGEGAVRGQPGTWTLVDVEAPSERSEELATALSGALRPETGWYADFVVDDDHVVVFTGQIFRYRRGDDAARAEAVDYGRRVGTPEHQLDWGD